MADLITLIVFVLIYGGIYLCDYLSGTTKKQLRRYYTERMRECNLKGNKEMADVYLQSLVRLK